MGQLTIFRSFLVLSMINCQIFPNLLLYLLCYLYHNVSMQYLQCKGTIKLAQMLGLPYFYVFLTSSRTLSLAQLTRQMRANTRKISNIRIPTWLSYMAKFSNLTTAGIFRSRCCERKFGWVPNSPFSLVVEAGMWE